MEKRTFRNGAICRSQSPHTLLLAVFLVWTMGVAQSAFSQQSQRSHPLIVLTELSAPSGDTVAQTLASSLTSSLDLELRLTGSLHVERADFLTPSLSLRRAAIYYRRVRADGAVFGSVTRVAGGGYAIDLEVWKAAKPNQRPVEVKRTVSNLLSSFDVADQMSLRVASTVVGRELSEGTLVVRDTLRLPHFSVYVDGHLMGRGRFTYRVLTGRHTVVVAKPGEIGDVPVQTFHVDITDGAETAVALSPKPRPKAVTAAATAPRTEKPPLASAPATVLGDFVSLPEATIPLRRDFSGWKGILPAFVAHPANTGSLVMNKVYLAVDSRYLYMRFDIAATGRIWFLHPSNFDTHDNSSYGMDINYNGRHMSANVGYWTGDHSWHVGIYQQRTDGTWATVYSSTAGYMMRGNSLEAKFPLRIIRKYFGTVPPLVYFNVVARAGYTDKNGNWVGDGYLSKFFHF